MWGGAGDLPGPRLEHHVDRLRHRVERLRGTHTHAAMGMQHRARYHGHWACVCPRTIYEGDEGLCPCVPIVAASVSLPSPLSPLPPPLPSSYLTPHGCILHVIVCEQVIFEVDGNTVRRVNLPRPLKPMQLQLAV